MENVYYGAKSMIVATLTLALKKRWMAGVMPTRAIHVQSPQFTKQNYLLIKRQNLKISHATCWEINHSLSTLYNSVTYSCMQIIVKYQTPPKSLFECFGYKRNDPTLMISQEFQCDHLLLTLWGHLYLIQFIYYAFMIYFLGAIIVFVSIISITLLPKTL